MTILKFFQHLVNTGYYWKCLTDQCSGKVVSGTHDGVIHVGFKCDTCKQVRGYAPAFGPNGHAGLIAKQQREEHLKKQHEHAHGGVPHKH